MFLSPLQHWVGEYRRKQCARTISPTIALIVDKAHLAGWSREEVLIAIADAADHQLADITGTSIAKVIDNVNPPAGSPEGPVQNHLSVQRNGTILIR
ncbi:hypothetical protein [Rhizobium sp. PL01]|uniref:hypothetical protein n=1 Tax=Rhizobium sp. PL01 TaxID=3085631 RepID=UPI002980D7A2|nr:hypothetical protein [Rhizobium sp. PL01]MDW5314465.1 hypothetical protein [Rhizobium sp. PL01]